MARNKHHHTMMMEVAGPIGANEHCPGRVVHPFLCGHCWTLAIHPSTGSKEVLTLQDAFTKYPEAYPLATQTAEQIAQVLINHIFPRYRVGFTIVTDQGRQFMAALIRHVAKCVGVITLVTQAYEPHSDPVERMHRTIEASI